MPNAYVNQDNNLFISTGLLKYTTSYEAVVGVLAHEIGHIHHFHVAKKKDSIKKLKNINQLSNLSVIAGSLIANNNEYLLQSLVTNSAGINNYYQHFNRDQEREADFYAVETLDRLNLSKKPLLSFLQLLEKKAIERGIEDIHYKFLTHPIYKERYKILDYTNSKNNLNFDKKTNKKFNYIKSKLFGFTEENNMNLNQYLKDDYLMYAEAIILSKQGKLKESMQLLNKLIKDNEHLYFLETKADILYSHGYLKEALLFYNKSISNLKDNHYVNKRIFDIQFNLEKNNKSQNSYQIFNEFSYLLEKFYYDQDLKNKFKKLANINELNDWKNYFAIEEKINKNLSTNSDMIIEDMKNIRKNTIDKNLIKLINKKLSEYNENI